MRNGDFDFTIKRLGSRDPVHGHKIIICEKCGLRGADDGIRTMKNGTRVRSVTHSGKLTTVAGLPMFNVDKWCSYVIAEAAHA